MRSPESRILSLIVEARRSRKAYSENEKSLCSNKNLVQPEINKLRKKKLAKAKFFNLLGEKLPPVGLSI